MPNDQDQAAGTREVTITNHPYPRSPASAGYARQGRDCYGVQVPCTRLGVSRSSVYQMTAPIDKVRGEGNCGRVTDRGEEARECVRKCRPDCAAGRILTEAARLRTETSYKAGSTRRVSTTSQSRSQSVAQVNDELVQRNITRLSGETCQAACEPPLAPANKACLKGGTRSIILVASLASMIRI